MEESKSSVGSRGSRPAASSGVDSKKQKSTMKKMFSKTALGATFEEVPDSVLDAEDVNLSIWSVLATDNSLRTVADLHRDRTTVRLRRESVTKLADATPGVALSMTDLTRANIQKGRSKKGPVFAVRINGADKVTDAGIKAVADVVGTNLLHLEMNNVTQVTDVGLRCVTLACTNLETLHMDNLSRVKGAGLSALASSCPRLMSLSLGGCSQFDEWTYQGLSKGCPELRHLNLNHCTKVTDAVLKVFARWCPHLRTLKLAHCKALSDVGLLQISNRCTGLETLDLTRTELPFKVTDVALLALGERCNHMSHVNLEGCSFITDIGMNWLAGGCPSLTYLNLSGLLKLTDTALLALSENCPMLVTLNLAGLKKISDVGVRFLSQGCLRLEDLDLTGVFLITDGKVRDFGLEGLQALSAEVTSLKRLRLPGCYNVGPISLASFGANCPNLKTLDLALCPKIDASGLGPLTAGCSTLTSLSLRGCSYVDDSALHAIAANGSALSKLNLSDVELITDTGVAALVRGCRALRILNLTKCTGVSDLSLLAIAEAKMNPGLRQLVLDGCYDCTDTGVSWLAERCPTIVKLNLLGCTVSRPGLRAMLHAWKHVRLRDDEEWLGPFPAERANELKFIEEYGEQWKAAQRMQTIFRGRAARKRAAQMREHNLREWTITRLQTLWKRRKQRKAYIVMLMKRRNEDEVATRIQTLFRIKMAKRTAEERRQAAWVRKMHASATLIQRIYRGKRARDIMAMARAARDAYYRQCVKAATDIQRAYRGRQGRVAYKLAIAAQKALEIAKEEAAVLLNRVLRGKLGRKRAQAQRQWWADQRKREEWAALLVQRHIRGLFGRRVLQRLQQDEETRQQAALWIQSRWRARQGRMGAHLLKQARRIQRETQAAIMVQAAWRAKQGRFAAFLLQRAKAVQKQREIEAAIMLQRVTRGVQGRKTANQKRAERTLTQLKQHDLFSWGAITVQKTYRGYVARRRVFALRQQHERRWKELYDDETGRPFYYDKSTGEIRWRRPQHLLNQLPKPVCDNCEDQLAMFECKHCVEFFCVTCWPQVHFGGKRKDHLYRPLYDAYDHRIDYGDGEWPSVWPSEIEQDEFVGWTLPTVTTSTSGWDATGGVVSPDHRREYNPMITMGGPTAKSPPHWAEQTVVESGGSGWGKHWDATHEAYFYRNDVTGEVTWERPLEFMTPRYDGEPVLEEGAGGWTKHLDAEQGTEFFYNELTGETSWERPTGFVTPRYTGQVVVESGAGGWTRHFDDASEAYFYMNADTGETQWERPPEFSTPRYDDVADVSDVTPAIEDEGWTAGGDTITTVA